MPNNSYALWATNGSDELQELIWLGNTKKYQKGKMIKEVITSGLDTQQLWREGLQKYMSNEDNWGNPFYQDHIHHSSTLVRGTLPPLQQLASTTTQYTGKTKYTQANMQKVTEDLFITVRYNPFKDKGYDNNIYILPNYTSNEDNLEPLPDIDLQMQAFQLA